MLRRNLLLIATLVFCSTIARAQKKRNIYLGSAADTSFETCTYNKKYNSKNFLVLDLFEYRTFRHEPILKSTTEQINREGIILEAKRTDHLKIKAEAVFGRDDLTCLVNYDAAVEKITNGRSALVSIMNLFSKAEDKVPQDDPSSHLRKVKVSGKISLTDTIVDFVYVNNFNKSNNIAGLAGILWYRGDSLSLLPLKTYYNKKGNKKKGYIGFSLAKGDTILAAADIYNGFTIYVSKSLSEEEKLLISTYFLVVITFMEEPPFVDWIPN